MSATMSIVVVVKYFLFRSSVRLLCAAQREREQLWLNKFEVNEKRESGGNKKAGESEK